MGLAHPRSVAQTAVTEQDASANLLCRNRRPTDDHVAPEQAGGLARGGAEELLVELELQNPMIAGLRGARDAAGDRARVVAQADGVDLAPRPVQASPADRDAPHGQLLARADDDAVG